MSQADPKTNREAGFPPAGLPDPGNQPAGDNRWGSPAFQQTLSILDQFSRTFWWTHDEALKDSRCNAEAMLRDAVITTALNDRVRPAVQLEYQFEPRDPTDPDQKQLAEACTEIFEDIPDFQDFRRSLLYNAIWAGRSANQCVYAWDEWDPTRMGVQKWDPIDPDSLVFKFDGTVGVMVNAQLSGPGIETVSGRGGKCKFFNDDQRQQLIVHEFERAAAPYYQYEMAGSIHGTGYRGRVYWYWWLKHNLQKILFDFLRKVGNGFFLLGYEAGNRLELENLQAVMEKQGGHPVIYVPLGPGRDSLDQVVENLPVNLQGANFQLEIIQYINQLIRDAILGQSMGNKPAPVGIGGGNAEHMGITDDERVKYDAVGLEGPLQFLTNVICRYTAPRIRPPRFQHLADKRNPEEFMASCSFAAQLGLPIAEDDIRSELGLPKPNDGDAVVTMVQGQQAAMGGGAIPGGVPMQGQPGPVDQSGQPQQPQVPDEQAAQQIQPANEQSSLPTQ